MKKLLVVLILGLVAWLGTAFFCHGQTLQEKRWRAADLDPRFEHEAKLIVTRIMANAARYKAVDSDTCVPWYVIASLHNEESDGDFRTHLHNGDPLTARTRNVPAGRPPTGRPPFTWEFSATDALLYDHMDLVMWAWLDDTLYACERYNGTGYLKYHPTVPTPYIWNGTTIAVPGKYVSDGKWSSTARSSQIGIAPLWKMMESMGVLKFSRLKLK